MGGQGLGVNDYLSVRAGVVATRAYRVVQQQGYLGFEGSMRRDFAKLGVVVVVVVVVVTVFLLLVLLVHPYT